VGAEQALAEADEVQGLLHCGARAGADPRPRPCPARCLPRADMPRSRSLGVLLKACLPREFEGSLGMTPPGPSTHQDQGRVPFLRARARARARNGKSTRFSRNWPSVRNEHEHEYLCSFSITFVLVLDVRVRKNRTARTLRGSCSNRSQVVRGIFRARTITTFGDRFVLVLHNRTCGVKRNGRNLVDEHGLREMCSCAYLFHTTRAKRKLRARARARARRNGTRPKSSL